MTSGGLFSIARSALLTHQRSLQTISQNIANAETPGYSRQEAVLVATPPVRSAYGSVGTGVTVDTVIRKRSLFLDDGFRMANGLAGESEMRRDLVTGLEAIFGEPSDTGMASALDRFWGAWSDLATTPGSPTARSMVQQSGRQLAQLLNQYDAQLTQQRTATIDRLAGTVAQVNALAAQVAELNGRIVSSEGLAGTANDLRDLRDQKLDELSRLAGARVVPQADGSATVLIGNSTLVDGTAARPLQLSYEVPTPPPTTPPSDLPVRLSLGASVDRLAPLGGELQAMVATINGDIPTLRGRLDALAAGLATAVNAEHVQGFVFAGTTIPGTAAGNFFDPGTLAEPVRAGTLRLAAAIEADAGAIAISRNATAPFDNGNGLAMGALRTATAVVSWTAPSGATESGGFLGFFRNTVGRLGFDVRAYGDEASIRRTLADQANDRRQSVSGVNTDEELVQMLRVQQAYVAATKLIKTADEMLQTLLATF
jgi:flagellar hook-associated protein 1 FlgK